MEGWAGAGRILSITRGGSGYCPFMLPAHVFDQLAGTPVQVHLKYSLDSASKLEKVITLH